MPEDRNEQYLMECARAAAKAAHCPYSEFHVGAAVLDDRGNIHMGCNVENASYGLTICAERSAIFQMVASGGKRIQKIAVTCRDAPEGSPTRYRVPCGACRQVIAEFADDDTPVIVDGVGIMTLAQLLPEAFRL